ncbi:MAG: tyrosine-type recombinase/integrase [Firmicutes bacterium]|nr:tyrosine-type recombinase/integrase [Bacillota bacterium]
MGKAGVPYIPFRNLRDTHATILLLAGIHPKVVSERLGHSDVGTTLNIYSHVLPSIQRESASARTISSDTSLQAGHRSSEWQMEWQV